MKLHLLFPSSGFAFSLLLALGPGWRAASAEATLSIASGSHSENFDSLGAGVSTPAHWHVGCGAKANLQTVTINDGSIGPGADIAAFNFGLTVGAPDRALGTIPASGDRNIELRLRNNSGRSIHSFTVRYDGEQWRIGTLVTPTALVLRYSADGIDYVDLGPGFNFTSPRLALPPLLQDIAVNGNESNNRVSGIGGLYTPAAPVPDGAIIYLRWFDADETGADPGLAIDNFSFSIITPGGPPLALRDTPGGDVTSWPGVQVGRLAPRIEEWVGSQTTELGVPLEGRPNGTASLSVNALRFFSPPQSGR